MMYIYINEHIYSINILGNVCYAIHQTNARIFVYI